MMFMFQLNRDREPMDDDSDDSAMDSVVRRKNTTTVAGEETASVELRFLGFDIVDRITPGVGKYVTETLKLLRDVKSVEPFPVKNGLRSDLLRDNVLRLIDLITMGMTRKSATRLTTNILKRIADQDCSASSCVADSYAVTLRQELIRTLEEIKESADYCDSHEDFVGDTLLIRSQVPSLMHLTGELCRLVKTTPQLSEIRAFYEDRLLTYICNYGLGEVLLDDRVEILYYVYQLYELTRCRESDDQAELSVWVLDFRAIVVNAAKKKRQEKFKAPMPSGVIGKDTLGLAIRQLHDIYQLQDVREVPFAIALKQLMELIRKSEISLYAMTVLIRKAKLLDRELHSAYDYNVAQYLEELQRLPQEYLEKLTPGNTAQRWLDDLRKMKDCPTVMTVPLGVPPMDLMTIKFRIWQIYQMISLTSKGNDDDGSTLSQFRTKRALANNLTKTIAELREKIKLRTLGDDVPAGWFSIVSDTLDDLISWNDDCPLSDMETCQDHAERLLRYLRLEDAVCYQAIFQFGEDIPVPTPQPVVEPSICLLPLTNKITAAAEPAADGTAATEPAAAEPAADGTAGDETEPAAAEPATKELDPNIAYTDILSRVKYYYKRLGIEAYNKKSAK
jgi:hypothetical protein